MCVLGCTRYFNCSLDILCTVSLDLQSRSGARERLGSYSPHRLVLENLRETLGILDKEGKEIILVGDTSCNFKDRNNANTKTLKFIYSEYQIEQ